MEYFYRYWGPLLLTTNISDSFYSFLDEAVKDSSENKYSFQHEVVKMKKEHEFSPENKVKFMTYFEDHLMTYYDAYLNVWFQGKEPFLKSFELINVWVNWQGPGEFRNPHTHDGHLSFVIYYDIPDLLLKEAEKEDLPALRAGSIVFQNALQREENPFHGINQFAVTPQNGQCYIFPNDLMHYTNPFQSDCTRISISGNLKVIT